MNSKILIFTNILFLSAALFFAFNNCSFKKPACKTICSDYSGAGTFKMNSNVLKMMSTNYYYGNSPATHNTSGDARSVWFSLRTLKTFLWQIESEVCKKNAACKAPDSLLGVRIYYARYPDNATIQNGTETVSLWSQYPAELGNLPANYAKQHTFFMVPTFDINGIHEDFDPFQTSFSSNCSPLKTLKDIIGRGYQKTEKDKTIFLAPGTTGFKISGLTPSADPAARNHGELCPPYPNNNNTCPGAYFQ